MGFEYGSQTIAIRNPFRLEGAAYALRGLVVAPLGVSLMLGVESRVAAGEQTLAWLWAGGGLLLLAMGLYALATGLFKLFRFYVGRGVPANLAAEVQVELDDDEARGPWDPTARATTIAPGSAGSFRHQGQYDRAQLSEMLLGRKNLTFVEPRGWLARLLHSVVYPMIFLPYPMRSITLKLFMGAWYAAVLFVLYGLALFSGTTGLTEITSTPVQDYLAAITLLALVLVWLRFLPRHRDLREPRLHSARVDGARQGLSWFLKHAILIGLAIAIPHTLLQIHAQEPLPALPVSPYPWLSLAAGLAVAALCYALLMCYRRAPRGVVPTDVSEYRAQWQESVHPMDLFRALEMTLANHRYLEIPNRVYRLKRPDLKGQGSENKGEFAGETLQEIQPEPLANQRRDWLLLPGVAAGQLLLLAAALWWFTSLRDLPEVNDAAMIELALAPLLLWLCGRSIASTANVYLGEIRFQSQLLAFRASGTYTESRLATGMSIYDSTRSENRIVRSSITPWLIVSRITSSIIAVSGTMNLEQKRYVLTMERNDPLCNELIDDIQVYLRERQVMAGVQSESDLAAASTIHRMNERTRAQRAALENDAHPPLSEEVLEGREQILGNPAEALGHRRTVGDETREE